MIERDNYKVPLGRITNNLLLNFFTSKTLILYKSNILEVLKSHD